MAIAEETVAAARAHGNPFLIAFALAGYGRAFTETDPARALDALRQGLAFAREHRLPLWEAIIAEDAAGLEAVHGELEQALRVVRHRHRLVPPGRQRRQPGRSRSPTWPCSSTASNDPRSPPPSTAPATHPDSAERSNSLRAVVDHLRVVLGENAFDDCVAAGAAMEPRRRRPLRPPADPTRPP